MVPEDMGLVSRRGDEIAACHTGKMRSAASCRSLPDCRFSACEEFVSLNAGGRSGLQARQLIFAAGDNHGTGNPTRAALNKLQQWVARQNSHAEAGLERFER